MTLPVLTLLLLGAVLLIGVGLLMKLAGLEQGLRALSDTALHAREAKEAALRLANDLAEVNGRIEGQAQMLALMRTETAALLRASEASVTKGLGEIFGQATASAAALNDTALKTVNTVALSLADLKAKVDESLKSEMGAIRKDNGEQLEAMRKTVDEKLHATLEQRLGESFQRVSDQLEKVHRGLGEMQTLATGVGDLRKVLTNVKTRGTWGEVQLDNLLSQVLTPEQYEKNVAPKPGSAARVEFALKLPGRSDDGRGVLLPIDAKFPLEDYQRLIEAQELGDLAGVEEASKALEVRIRIEAKSIRDKYVEPPHTTDFAVLYLSTEGLYAEVLRRPGLAEWMQTECRVMLAGPTTLAAMLNSLQMGFRTLAIEQRSSEVWKVLGAVKTEFLKFGDALAKTKKKLEEASNTLDNAEVRNRALTRRLKSVESLPGPEAIAVLGGPVELGSAEQGDDD